MSNSLVTWDNEYTMGNGPAFALGYRHYFSDLYKGFFIGFKVDSFFFPYRWAKRNQWGATTYGNSTGSVIVPNFEIGYEFLFNEKVSGYVTANPGLAFPIYPYDTGVASSATVLFSAGVMTKL